MLVFAPAAWTQCRCLCLGAALFVGCCGILPARLAVCIAHICSVMGSAASCNPGYARAAAAALKHMGGVISQRLGIMLGPGSVGNVMHQLLHCQAELASLRCIVQACGFWMPLLAFRVCRSLYLGQRHTGSSAWLKAACEVCKACTMSCTALFVHAQCRWCEQQGMCGFGCRSA